MSHTNSTTHYNLPQFVGTDTPGWLTDVNSAMSSIDNAIFARQQESVSNSDAITANTAAISGLTTRMDSAEQNITDTGDQVSAHTASIATLQSQVTQNTGDIAGLATRVTNLDGTDVSYDPAGTDLTATDVQAAITEVNTKVASAGGIDLLWTNSDPTQTFAAQDIVLDLTDYKMLVIAVKWSTTRTEMASVTVPKDGLDYSIVIDTQGSTLIRYDRHFQATDAGVRCTEGAQAGTAINNNFAIPYKIYGMK